MSTLRGELLSGNECDLSRVVVPLLAALGSTCALLMNDLLRILFFGKLLFPGTHTVGHDLVGGQLVYFIRLGSVSVSMPSR